MTLLQCIKSARWPSDRPLSIFPGVEPIQAQKNSGGTSPLPPLTEVAGLPTNALNGLMDRLSVPTGDRPQFTRASSMLPNLNIFVPEPSAIEVTISISRRNKSGALASHRPTPASSSERPPLSEFRVWAPLFPKPQTEGFFVIVADEAKDDIIALRRVTWPSTADQHAPSNARGGQSSLSSRRGGSNVPSIRASLKIPASPESRNLDVLVVSDAYVGMQWRVKGVVQVPGAPRFDDDKGKDGGKPSAS